MSITSISANQAGPIIQGLINQNGQSSGGKKLADPARVLAEAPTTLADSFEPGEAKNDEAQKIAQIRRFAAQQQAVSLAPPQQGAASSAAGLVSTDVDGDNDNSGIPDVDGDTLASTKQPSLSSVDATGLSGVANVNPNQTGSALPDVVGDTLAPTKQTPVTSQADSAASQGLVTNAVDGDGDTDGDTLPDVASDTAAPGNQTFTSADRDRLLSLFGSTQGDKGFDSTLDLNGDGSINGADLASLLVNLSNSTKSSGPESAKQTPGQILQGILKTFGAQIGKNDSNSIYDVNGDGLINGADLAQSLVNGGQQTGSTNSDAASTPGLKALLSAFGSVAGDSSFSRALDVTSDGQINGADLAQFLTQQLNNDS